MGRAGSHLQRAGSPRSAQVRSQGMVLAPGPMADRLPLCARRCSLLRAFVSGSGVHSYHTASPAQQEGQGLGRARGGSGCFPAVGVTWPAGLPTGPHTVNLLPCPSPAPKPRRAPASHRALPACSFDRPRHCPLLCPGPSLATPGPCLVPTAAGLARPLAWRQPAPGLPRLRLQVPVAGSSPARPALSACGGYFQLCLPTALCGHRPIHGFS